jgi:phosphoglycerate dehydrogenase-like enzyme
LIFITLRCVIVTELEKHILDIHVLAYVMAKRIKRAKNLQLLFTARIGFDHIDLNAATTVGFLFEKPIKD